MKRMLIATVALTIAAPALAANLPVYDGKRIIRACADHLSVQVYAWRDTKDALWYGALGSPLVRLDEKALDGVCPEMPMLKSKKMESGDTHL